jgi:predicted alpha/beta-hydrolase family hydrolase
VSRRTEEALDTDQGPARLVTDHADPTATDGGPPAATLLLSHGAGAGIETRDLVALAETLPGHGITVVRLEQPWRVAGRAIATAPPTLDVALRAAAAGHEGLAVPLVLGGRSAGARSACRCARETGAEGVVALSFPLHPPGRPERSRVEELRGAGVPTLVVQGERDPMGRPEELPEDLDHLDVAVVPGADHGLAVGKRGPVTQEEALDVVVQAVLEWLVREVLGAPGPR